MTIFIIIKHLIKVLRINYMRSIHNAITDLLIERGWKIDETAKENKSGELHCFIDPKIKLTIKRLTWHEAIATQESYDIAEQDFIQQCPKCGTEMINDTNYDHDKKQFCQIIYLDCPNENCQLQLKEVIKK
jgi:hypothetical protein